MKKEIFIALSTFSEYDKRPLELLKASGIPYSFNNLGRRLTGAEVLKMAHNASVVIAGVEPYDADVIAGLPNLGCISRCGAGVDNIDLIAAKARNIVVRNTPDAVVRPVAELTLAMILDLSRKVTYHTVLMRRGIWKKAAGSLICGKKIGVVGLGRIGRQVSEMLKKLDANVLGADPYVDKPWAAKAGIALKSLGDLLKESDIVTLHAAYATGRGAVIIGRPEIAAMKDGALFVNTSRGCLVDEKALYEALKDGKLAGAALDVYADEPYSGPLCGLDNVLMTPHIATLTVESRTEMEIEAARNAVDYFNDITYSRNGA